MIPLNRSVSDSRTSNDDIVCGVVTALPYQYSDKSSMTLPVQMTGIVLQLSSISLPKLIQRRTCRWVALSTGSHSNFLQKQLNVKVKLSLCSSKHHAMKTYGGMEV